ncbi:MAG: hypothetical protein HF973_16885 [Chloroflexi bacterium]|nr:hypothetical protein [Chloroflexota bacterium]
MADVYTVLFIVIGILISVPALLVALNLLMPQVTERAARRLDKSPGKSFAVGLPVTAVLLFWSLANFESNVGLLQTSAFIILFLWMALGAIGGAGVSRLLGRRIAPLSDNHSDIHFLLRGAIVYELAALVPFVGWFIFAPIVGIMAVGAAVLAVFGKRYPVSGNQYSVIGDQPSVPVTDNR